MKIVCIGGGHGLAQVLSAIKPLCNHLTAIVATTDNGGSTGRIRDEQDCIALGDIRRCCVQLAGEGTQAHAMYEHRFMHGDMAGHCLGNLTLLGLTQLTHSPTEAIASFNRLLGNKETVLPMSDLPTDLIAELNNGEKIFGECAIDALNELPTSVYLSKAVPPAPGAVEAILDADLIIIGPGSIITSVMPTFLITDITNAIKQTSACRIFIENTARESSVMQHTDIAGIDWLQKKLGTKIYDLSISPSAIIEILQQGEKCKETGKHLHNIDELKNVFSELLKSSFNAEKHA
ncbi:uridine diphosphate-N-acetylglucosamine-binding protein YvcK [Pseudoalteromonas sp. MQS005]|uniref:gluconeogenesis factor YvcK family protein n=1 Tax=Pseudoalteromonas sp. MQS005 TaxID=1854052 RepID=UPI0007E5018D|nr:uridine diphosphate-N-acetylglucosamine-binding protein YvcK [Pseudoalteromonas sp. MQS005]